MPPTRRLLIPTVFLAAMAASVQSAHATSIISVPIANPGFEILEPTTGPAPTTFGDWVQDVSEIVGTQNGIDPFGGVQMLHFIATGSAGASGKNSDVWQLVDLSPYVSDIQNGKTTAVVSAYFNRVAGNAQTETRFHVGLKAFGGSQLPSQFPIIAESQLAQKGITIPTDSDPLTWEFASASLLLPSNTTWVALLVAALETINDSPAPEFDGHYVDNTSLSLIVSAPEPSSLLLLGTGLVAVRRRRGKR